MKAMIVGFLTGMMILSSAMAYAETVYTTKNGKKYHHADCTFIQKKSPVAVSMEEAQQKGLQACGKCFKDSVKTNPSDNVKKDKKS